MARYATARYAVKEAREATWARRVALFFVQLMILTVLLHRFASLTTPAALNLIGVSIAGLLIAIAIAVGAIVRIWFGGQTGAAQAFAAIFIACLGLAVPGFYLSNAVLLPRLTEVETTPEEPLDFRALGASARPTPTPSRNRTRPQVEAQVEAYPDIGPMVIERSAPEVFSIVHEAVERLGWTIALNEAPGETGIGRIEATDRTLIMGFTDDVIIQVKGDDAHATVDVRSVSRYGMHDLGANAEAHPQVVRGSEYRAGEGREDRARTGGAQGREPPQPKDDHQQARQEEARQVKSARPVARPLSRY